MTSELPMFPLETVLFPGASLPLHVFEPRYRVLVEHCLAGEAEFGVVLIERGSEVGGGDTRFDVGTVARIVQGARLDDGRYVLGTVGVERLRVRRWLGDAPFPRAEVDRLDEAGPAPGDPERRDDVARLLVRVLARRAELGEAAAPVDVALDEDPVRASYQAGALSGLGPLDAQGLLEIDGSSVRLDRLAALLADEVELLELRLGDPGGSAPDAA